MNRPEWLKNMAAAAAGTIALRTPLLAAENIGPATHRTPVLAEYERLRFRVSYHFSMNTFSRFLHSYTGDAGWVAGQAEILLANGNTLMLPATS
jgi:hypothetical protein